MILALIHARLVAALPAVTQRVARASATSAPVLGEHLKRFWLGLARMVERPEVHMRAKLKAGLAVVFCAVVAASVGGLASASRGKSGLARARGCHGNVYVYTVAELRACRVGVIPLTRVIRLPWGGHVYVYGKFGRMLIVPSHFNPLTATTVELDEYGLPERPRRPAALAMWKEEMIPFREPPAPPFLIQAGPLSDGAHIGGG